MSKYEFIHAEKAYFEVSEMCCVLGVARSGYYAWAARPASERELGDERLQTEIVAIHEGSRRCYGSPRVHAELKANGHNVGRKRVARIMRQNGLKACTKRRFRRTTDSAHRLPVAPNILAQAFQVDKVDQVWVGDITYVWTAEGWAYLAVLIDLYSRRVVGWALRKSLSRELALAALSRALTVRQPPGSLIHHTDRGCQYASAEYRRVLAEHGIRQSMSGVANCYDNAVAESFFASLKKELVHRTSFHTRSEAYDAIADYIDNFYNPKRRHSAIGYAAPDQFEATNRAAIAA